MTARLSLPLPQLLADTRDAHRLYLGLLQAQGDMQRRIKSEAKFFAARRLRAAGLLPVNSTKMPTVLSEDEDLVRVSRARWIIAKQAIDSQLRLAEKELEEIGRYLPIADMAESIYGLGIKSIASIVADAGDIAAYRSPAALWTRMGVGRKQKPDGTWVNQCRVKGKTKADKELAISMGYNSSRHSRLFMIASNLVKVAADCQTNKSLEYRHLYDYRRKVEIEKLEAENKVLRPASQITKANAESSMSLAQLNKRCLRYVAKRLLRDIWVAWRDAVRERETDAGSLQALPEAAD